MVLIKESAEEFGKKNLPKGWVRTKIQNICDLAGGGTPSRKIQEYFGGNISWFTPTEIPKDKIVEVVDSREKITELGLQKSSAKIVPQGSVLLTSRASIGFVSIAGVPVTTNQGFASFICSNAVYNYFLAYWLWANRGIITKKATGTTFKEISKTTIRQLWFNLPPLNEQKRIVSKIESIFAQIDACMKRLMDLQCRLKSGQVSLSTLKDSVLRQAFAERLVPQDLDDEALKPLEKIILSKIFETKHGKFLPRNKICGGKIPVFGGNGLLDFHNKENHEGDVLIIGRVGAQCGNVHSYSGKVWITDNSIGLVPKVEINLRFFLYQLKNLKLNKLSAGSGQPYISGKILSKIEISTTSIEKQNKITAKIESIFAGIDASNFLIFVYVFLIMIALAYETINQSPNITF